MYPFTNYCSYFFLLFLSILHITYIGLIHLCFIFTFTSEVYTFILLLPISTLFSLRSPFNISCKAGWLVMNSFKFCLSRKLFYLSFNSEQYLSQVENSWLITSFEYIPLACKVSADGLKRVPLFFSIAAFKILFFFTFNVLIMCLSESLWASWIYCPFPSPGS